MRKLVAVLGAVMIAYILASWSAGVTVSPETGYIQPGSESGGAAVYTLKSLDGRVAVYEDGEPVLVTDTEVASLPKADRVRLLSGITVFSKEELKQLLEDICS